MTSAKRCLFIYYWADVKCLLMYSYTPIYFLDFFFQRVISLQNLKIWKGNLSQELPSIEALSFDSSNPFTPPEHVLQGPKLQNITGVTWSGRCTNCTLLKNKTHVNVTRFRNGAYDLYPPSRCRGSRYTVNDVSRTFASNGFLPMCVLDNEECFASEISVTPLHQCWDSANNVLYAEYFFAPLLLIFNFIVFTSTLTTKTLRKVPSMLLVANLAVSDFFLGVYSLLITSLRHAMSYQTFYGLIDYLCPFLGFLWCFGQYTAALSSVLLTTERYIAIIFSMRPTMKLSSKPCFYSVIITWIIAIVVASLPFFGIGTYTTTTYCLPIQPAKGIPHSFAYSASLIASGFILYTITLPMYLHIFFHVSKSGNMMGVKRDGKLAKKISVLVVSNLLFFLLPVFIGLVWIFKNKAFENISLSAREILVGSFTTVCFSINSFLNPLLYAFRDRRFQFVIRQRYHRLVHANAVSEVQLSFRSGTDARSHVHKMTTKFQ